MYLSHIYSIYVDNVHVSFFFQYVCRCTHKSTMIEYKASIEFIRNKHNINNKIINHRQKELELVYKIVDYLKNFY